MLSNALLLRQKDDNPKRYDSLLVDEDVADNTPPISNEEYILIESLNTQE